MTIEIEQLMQQIRAQWQAASYYDYHFTFTADLFPRKNLGLELFKKIEVKNNKIVIHINTSLQSVCQSLLV